MTDPAATAAYVLFFAEKLFDSPFSFFNFSPKSSSRLSR